MKRRADGSWLVDGRTPVEEVASRFGLAIDDDRTDGHNRLLRVLPQILQSICNLQSAICNLQIPITLTTTRFLRCPSNSA